MRNRITLVVAAAAGTTASALAQEVVRVDYSWIEVVANTTIPVGANQNSAVDPGEGARIRLGVTALINGTNAVGQTVTYTSPIPGGVGTVRGLGSIVYDFIGDDNAPTAHANWTTLQGPGAPFTNGQSGGTVQPGGASLWGIGGSQFISPSGTANSANNSQQAFRGVWNPLSYAQRTVQFRARASVLVPSGQQNAILLAYGFGTGIDPTSGEPFFWDLLTGKYVGSDFGQGLSIPVVPAPASVVLASLMALPMFARRR